MYFKYLYISAVLGHYMLYFIPKISKIECQETELYMRQIWKYGGSDFVNFPSASGMASSFGLSKSITDEVF